MPTTALVPGDGMEHGRLIGTDTDPQPGTYQVGDDAVCQPQPDRWNPTGPLWRRITQITRRSDGPDVVSLTLAPLPASL